MSAYSPARRVRSGSIRLAAWVSVLSFVVVGGYALEDQWEIGHASLVFMLGTALLAAGICIALFAFIAAIGLAASLFFSDRVPDLIPPRAVVRSGPNQVNAVSASWPHGSSARRDAGAKKAFSA
jgi:hypothetical protein